MADEVDDGHDDHGAKVVAPSTRVSVAFPFSSITVTEPSGALIELAAIVHRLAVLAARSDDSGEADRIADDAARLLTRIGAAAP